MSAPAFKARLSEFIAFDAKTAIPLKKIWARHAGHALELAAQALGCSRRAIHVLLERSIEGSIGGNGIAPIDRPSAEPVYGQDWE